MVKKLQGETLQEPVRQSRRTRVLNTRLGTPPKILLDMLGDHSSSVIKKSTSPGTGMGRIEIISENITEIQSKQIAKPFDITDSLPDVTSHPKHNRSKKYAAPLDEMFESEYFSKSGKGKEIAAVVSNKSRKLEVSRNSKNAKLITSETLGNIISGARRSTRIRIPNPRFAYLLPDKKDDALVLEGKVVAQCSKAVCSKSDATVKPRYSQRHCIPSKRLSLPDVSPFIQTQKRSTKARSKIEKVRKCKNHSKKPARILKAGSAVKPTSRNLNVSSVVNNRQVHSSLDIPSILYPYKPARSEALCVEPSSSVTKDYVSKKDVDKLIAEINKALTRFTNEDYSELRGKVAHHLNNLYRENCRFRQALQQSRSELDSISSNTAVNCYNMLIKQNSELREMKLLADIKCEAQLEEKRKLLDRIKILEIQNKDLEDFRNRLLKQKRQQHLNGGTKYSRDELSRVEEQDVMNTELESLFLNRIGREVVKDDKVNSSDVAWGNDSWMLHC